MDDVTVIPMDGGFVALVRGCRVPLYATAHATPFKTAEDALAAGLADLADQD